MTITSSNNRTIITNKPSFIVDPEDKSIRKGKSVVCLTTGAIFKSGAEAAREYEISYCALNNHLNGRSKLRNGMNFMYVADMAFRVNDITSLIVELKAKELNKAEQVRHEKEKRLRAEAETKRVKTIYKEFIDKIKNVAETETVDAEVATA